MQVNTKKMLARLFAIGAGLALLSAVAMANPFVLDWRVIGFGADAGTCASGSFGSGCTSVTTGNVQGTHIGSGAYSLTITTGNDNAGGGTNNATNASGGKCLPANNNTLAGTVTAADGSTINFNTVGWLCEEGSSGSPDHYNGTYRITGGTGRFSGAMGGGSLVYTVDKQSLARPTYMKIDGTINF
jgi:hypothetical protein